MRMSYAFLLITALVTPSFAADGDEKIKQEIEKLAAAFAAGYDKQDSAGIAALFVSGGVLINPGSVHTDIAKYYEGGFKTGFNHNEITVNRVWPLGADTVLATGEFHATGKNESGAPLDNAGIWTATDVREGGTWKVKMLTAFPKPPPAK
jgi:ketosteroid isomerase-like protein